MKKILCASFIGLAMSQGAFAASSLDLSGTYTCHGYDSHDKGYDHAKVTMTLDKKNSELPNGFGAYHFQLQESDGSLYHGEAAANGNTLAIYFENQGKSAQDQTDRGVGIAFVTHDKDTQGKIQTVFHKFYYEPTYQGGGNGSETCIKD